MSLDELLQRWSDTRRLTDAQAEFIRTSIVRSPLTTESPLEFNWFWSLMRPVMDLIPSATQDPILSSPIQPYLRLV